MKRRAGKRLYRPTFRSEILRRLYFKYVKHGGMLSSWQHGAITLNWPLVARLIELSYRCNLCRRCAQTCPIGVDNGLVAHELRKLFSQEMGIAPKEIHDNGSMLQLRVGSSTGMNSEVVKDNIEFIDEDIGEKTGIHVETPWDVEGADVLLIHNAGEIMAWPENPGAFALILNAAGIKWTLSSELAGYDSINYGLWYDDAQFARVAIKHAEAARKLKVKKIVLGECGHAHKALSVIADRILTGDLNIPRESSMTLLRDIVMSDRLKLDPGRNDFPVTLHDPCNLVRLMGVVEPQREIVRKICPQFREMEPHGVDNYCCGGGSGFAIMSGHNFPDWRFHVAGRKKMEQILNAFADCMDPTIPKYLCAPCSNCKGQFRDMLAYYDLWESNRIPVRRPGGTDRQRHGGREAGLHRLGVALSAPSRTASILRRNSAARRGLWPPVETATCRLPDWTRAGTMKSHAPGSSATFTGMPRRFASRSTRRFTSRQLVAAYARQASFKSEGRNARLIRVTGSASNSTAQAGETTLTRAPASSKPLAFRSPTLPAPTTTTAFSLKSRNIG